MNDRDSEDVDDEEEDLPPPNRGEYLVGSVDTQLFLDSCESLVCSDIIFALLNDAFNMTEPIVYGFTSEAKKLNTDI